MSEQSAALESAAETTVRTFNALLAEKGVTFYIFDHLVGEMRYGVMGCDRPASVTFSPLHWTVKSTRGAAAFGRAKTPS